MAILSDDEADTDLSLAVTSSVHADLETDGLAQFALAFPGTTDNDDLADNLVYSEPALKVAYFAH